MSEEQPEVSAGGWARRLGCEAALAIGVHASQQRRLLTFSSLILQARLLGNLQDIVRPLNFVLNVIAAIGGL